MTVRYFASTISGFPGRSFRCKRNRNPFRCNQLLTSISGFVSFPRIAAMFRDRAADTGGLASVARGKELVLDAVDGRIPLGRQHTRHHHLGNLLDDRHHDGVAELPVGLGIGH